MKPVNVWIYWLRCVFCLWAAWWHKRMLCLVSLTTLPLVPGCGLHFLLYSILLTHTRAHASARTHTHTHILCNLSGWATQCEGSEVSSWAKPPQNTPRCAHMVWINAAATAAYWAIPINTVKHGERLLLNTLVNLFTRIHLTPNCEKWDLKMYDDTANIGTIWSIFCCCLLFNFRVAMCSYSPKTERKLALKSLWRFLLLHFSCERQQNSLFNKGLPALSADALR